MKLDEIEIEEVDFAAMLEESFAKTESKGDLIKVPIVKIDENDNIFVVSVGHVDMSINLDEIKDENGNLLFNINDEIQVLRQRNGVSYRAAKAKEALVEFIESYDESLEYIVEGKVVSRNKGGYVVLVDDLEMFLPRAQSYLPGREDNIGKHVRAIIIKVDKDRASVTISRKELIEREKAEIDSKIEKLLSTKETISGTIRKITTYGLFVDIGGMDGLVHYSEISHKGPVNPSKMFKEGEKVEVKAIRYDKEKKHLSLSIKEALPSPWDNIDAVIKKGDTVKATVANIESYGAFVDIGEDLEAFLHVSEISWEKNVKNPADFISTGEEIDVEVIEVDKLQKRLRVSMKRLLPKPIDEFRSQFSVGDVVKGEITSVTDFGAFVKVGSLEGLLHNSEISWDKSKNASNSFNVGEEVEVKIIKIDRDNDKISLSIKAMSDSPVAVFAREHKNGDIVTGTLRDKKEFGLFIQLTEEVDALIRSEDLYPLRADELEIGQEIRGVITMINSQNGMIRVSVRRLEKQEERAALEELNKNQDTSMTLGDAFGDLLKK